MLRQVQAAASRVSLKIVVEPVAKKLHGVTNFALDEKATLRRVALFYRGTGRYTLSQPERDAALEVIRDRFDERFDG